MKLNMSFPPHLRALTTDLHSHNVYSLCRFFLADLDQQTRRTELSSPYTRHFTVKISLKRTYRKLFIYFHLFIYLNNFTFSSTTSKMVRGNRRQWTYKSYCITSIKACEFQDWIALQTRGYFKTDCVYLQQSYNKIHLILTSSLINMRSQDFYV